MFGYTPPLIVMVDGSLLRDCAGFQQVATALESQLLRRPVWAVSYAPEALLGHRDPAALRDAIEAMLTDPRIPLHAHEPARYTLDAYAERATVRILQAHLEDFAVHVPEVTWSDREPLPRHPAAVMAGRLVRDDDGRFERLEGDPLAVALRLAEEMGSPQVQVWCRPEDVLFYEPAADLADQAHFAGVELEACPPRMAGPVPALWP